MDKDILIIGGGPAGLSTALHLQRLAPGLAARTMVLEKAHHPRPKLCAGGLVADAEVLLEGLGLDVRDIPHVDVSAAHFDFEGKGLTIRLPGRHALRVIRRDEFDAWLAASARERGIEILEGVNVRAIRQEKNGVVVETDMGVFHARMVIGADGSNGLVRRSIAPGATTNTARVLEVLTPPESGRQHKELDAYFDFRPMPDGLIGYTWDFPSQVNQQAVRCWGVYDANLWPGNQRVGLKETLEKEMGRCGFSLSDHTIQGHPIHWFDPSNTISAERVLLVGDAAGADPIFGEGISMALGYGKLAAREIVRAFTRQDFSFKDYKQRLLRSPLGQTLLARWLITQVMGALNWRWFQTLLWRWLQPIVMVIAWIFVLNWAKRMH